LKPTVLHIIDSFESGGTERQAIQLVRLLHEGGHCEVHLACLQNKGSLRAEADNLGLGKIAEYPLTSFHDLNFVSQLRRLRSFLQEKRIDVVHTHDFYTNIFGMAAARTAGVRARIASKRETEGFRSPLQKRVERGAFRLAHRVVANSDAVRARLISEGVHSEKIVTLYNGLELERVDAPAGLGRDEALSHLNVKAESRRRFVTIVANLNHAVKDHPTFLQAAAQVRAKISDAAFLIAGEGELLPRLRDLAAQLGLESDVFFLGRCENIAQLLFASDVCVLSSTAEGFSNAILEYMAAARPVVVTDVGGAREAVVSGETGYVVPPRDVEAMAEGIIGLLSERKKAEAMGRRGRQRVVDLFSTRRQLEGTLKLYADVLGHELSEAGAVDRNVAGQSASSPVNSSVPSAV
jgi:glycosyltransferase involved in cell wall biosynthesis